MKTIYGEITAKSFTVFLLTALIPVMLLIVAVESWPPTPKAWANQLIAHKHIIDGEYTNPYVVFYDSDPTSDTIGMVRDKTTGIAETTETYAANALTVGAGITLDDQSGRWVVSVPPLPSGKNKTAWIIADSASPAKTDIPAFQDFYDMTDKGL
jgi:hypothetical protein